MFLYGTWKFCMKFWVIVGILTLDLRLSHILCDARYYVLDSLNVTAKLRHR